MKAEAKSRVPAEVAYLPEDSVVRVLPLSSFVVLHKPGTQKDTQKHLTQKGYSSHGDG